MMFGVRSPSALRCFVYRSRSITSRAQNLTGARSSTSSGNFFNARLAHTFAISSPSVTCLPVDHVLPPAPVGIIVARYFSQRVKDSRSIQEVLDSANKQFESGELTARTAAAVWSTIPRLLSKGVHNAKSKDIEIMECELQIFNILEVVINSLDVLNARDLSTITLGMAKIIQNVRDVKQRKRINIYQRAFGNVMLDESSNIQGSIFQPLAERANDILTDCEPRHLSNLAYAHALLGYDPKLDNGSTLLGNIADASIESIRSFNSQDISNTVWAYSTLEVSHPLLFQEVGNAITKKKDLESFTPQALANTIWAYAKANEQHAELFKKVGDTIVAKDDLASFDPRNFSNIVWAYATANEQHPGLFRNVGDVIVKKDNLEPFTPQNLANVVWAYATANEQHPGLFRKVGDTIVKKDNLESFTPQALANTAWAYATANEQHPGLFRKVGDTIVKKDHLESFKPQELANTVWAYATANEQHPGLFGKVGDTIVKKDNLESFDPQALANTVWAYATTNEQHPGLFMKIGDAIIGNNDLKSFNSQALTNIAWSFAVSNHDLTLVFGTGFREEIHARQNEMIDEDLFQLHQWHLWQTKEKANDGLPKSIQDKCKQVFLSSDTRSSALQKDVVCELKALNLTPVEEYLTPSGYSLDALVEIKGNKVGVEVDGPSHFIGREPNGSTLLKRRQVTTIDKIPLVSVPYWEWNKRGKDRSKRRQYLQTLFE